MPKAPLTKKNKNCHLTVNHNKQYARVKSNHILHVPFYTDRQIVQTILIIAESKRVPVLRLVWFIEKRSIKQ